MKYFLHIQLLLIVSSLNLFALPKGVTENLPESANIQIENNKTGFRQLESENKTTKPKEIIKADIFDVVDEQEFDIFIPPNGFAGFKIEQYQNKLLPINSYKQDEKINQALEKAPLWLRNRLQLNLSLLSENFKNLYCDMIINAEWPYIDEIAFVIANMSAELLSSKYFYPDLIVQNAKSVYAHDADLKYVDIVEYGSIQNKDYYTTVVYKKKNKDSIVEQIEVPTDIYYWYIVYPKLSDEIPTYVHPQRVECSLTGANHTLNIAAPDKGGVFWRDYLYEHTEKKADSEDMYPILKDMVNNAEYLWDETSTNTKTAIGELTTWVKSVMAFTSKDERPHQPVRIYSMHIGRCGEHEDLTNAIARACLIPSRGISAISEDHVWNEFWDKDWQQWEPVNTSYYNKAVYGEKGWGKIFGSVYARRGDGVTTSVTNQGYSENTCNITIKVVDKNRIPIDGAYVALYKKRIIDGNNYIVLDSYGTTNFIGECTFNVGYKNTYFANVKSSFGNLPQETNKVMQCVENPEVNKDYEFEFQVSGAKTLINPNISEPYNLDKNYMLEFDYQGYDITKWVNNMDDLPNMPCYWADNSKSGTAFLLLNELEFANLTENKPFTRANNDYLQCSNGKFDVKFERFWYNYAIFYNCYNTLNPVYLNIKATLLKNLETKVDDNLENSSSILPNPANDYIQFSNDASNYSISIYNSIGFCVKSLQNHNKTLIDIRDLPVGTYFINYSNGINSKTEKFVIIR